MKLIYRLKQFILIAGDLTSFAIGSIAALGIRNFSVPTSSVINQHLILFSTTFFLWVVVNYINGLYDLERLSAAGKSLYRRHAEAATIACIASIIFFYILPEKTIAPKTILVLNIIIGYTLSAIWRSLYSKLIGTKRLFTNLMFVGYTPETHELMEIVQRHPEKGYKIVAIIDPTKTLKSSDFPGIHIFYGMETVRPAITNYKVHVVAIAPHLRQDPEALRELYELLFWKTHICDLASLYEIVTGRIPPSTFSEGWFLDHLRNRQQPVYDHIRIVIDYFALLAMGIIFLATLPLVALLIKATSKGPLFIKQKRVGQYGQQFVMYKYRSMYALSPDGSAELEGVEFAQKNDKRITPIGRILRKTRFDELPQVFNLLQREITLIGPRPERPEIVDTLLKRMPYYPLRHIVKPGLTGWAVIHQDYTDTLEKSLQKLQYDLYYIKNKSMLIDLSILLRTVNVVVRLMGQ